MSTTTELTAQGLMARGRRRASPLAIVVSMLATTIAVAFVPATAAQADDADATHDDQLPAANHRDWMSWLPDDVNLTALSVPGAHDAATLFAAGNLFEKGYARTQSMFIGAQLDSGIRALDIRAKFRNNDNTDPSDDYFTIAHGSVDVVDPATDSPMDVDVVFGTVCGFLGAHPQETVIMRFGDSGLESYHDGIDDNDATVLHDAYLAAWDRYIDDFRSCVWLPADTPGVEVPDLGDVRGKIVFVPRGNGVAGLRENSTLDRFGPWRDHEWSGGTSRFLTVVSVNNHVGELVDAMHAADTDDSEDTFHFVGFDASGGATPWDFANGRDLFVADGVNERMVEWMLGLRTIDGDDGLSVGETGIAMMDFPDASVIEAVIAHNFDLVDDPLTFEQDADRMMEPFAHQIENEVDNDVHERNDAMFRIWRHFLPGSALHAATAKTDGWYRNYDHNGFAMLADEVHDYRHIIYMSDGEPATATPGQLEVALRLYAPLLATVEGNESKGRDLAEFLRLAFPGHGVSVHVGDDFDKIAYIRPGGAVVGGLAPDLAEPGFHVALYDGPQVPTPVPGGPYAVNEGETITLDASGTANSATWPLEYRWDVDGDGTFDIDWTSSPTATYDTTGPFSTTSATLEVRYGTSSASAAFSVDVSDAPPAFTPTVAPSPVDEGSTTTVTGTVVESGVGPFPVSIDWGDGSNTTTDTGADPSRDFSADHVYDDNGAYTVTVTVTDDEGSSTTETANVSVENVAPVVNASLDFPSADEGDVVVATIGWTDPGADEHTITIDWGDGTLPDEVNTTSGERTVDVPHTWLDDNPPGTPSGTYDVAVTVTDDDGGVGDIEIVTTVSNLAPTASFSATPSTIDENDTVTVAGTIADASATGGDGDSFVVDVEWGDGRSDQQMVDASAARAFELTHQYLDDGSYDVAVTVTDDDTGSVVLPTQTITVENLDPVVMAPDPATVLATQYSDPFQGVAVFTATDVAGYPEAPETLSATATFDGAALPGEFTLSAPTCGVGSRAGLADPVQSCSWTIDSSGTPLLLPPGDYPLAVTVTDDDGGSHTTSVTVTVEPEDARVDYTGPLYAATTSADDDTATVELRATVRDISIVTDDPSTDPWPGDISNATVTFIDRDSGDELCTAAVAPIFTGDDQIGTATCVWTASLGNLYATPFTIGLVVGGYYTRNETDDDTVVTVARPLDRFITGGGFLEYDDPALTPAGVYAPDAGTKANFGFNVKFNKKGTKLQGRATIIVRSGGGVYRIKTNRLDSLGIWGDDPTMAEFEARANLSDVTDEANPVAVAGNLRLQMRMTDFGTPADIDLIGWTLYDKDGTLLFSSNWQTVDTAQAAATGNLALHH